VVAVFQMAADLGAITGPLVAGWFADNASFGAAWGSVAVVLAFGLVASVTMPGRTAVATRRAPDPPP
jgi:MFS family permease